MLSELNCNNGHVVNAGTVKTTNDKLFKWTYESCGYGVISRDKDGKPNGYVLSLGSDTDNLWTAVGYDADSALDLDTGELTCCIDEEWGKININDLDDEDRLEVLNGLKHQGKI